MYHTDWLVDHLPIYVQPVKVKWIIANRCYNYPYKAGGRKMAEILFLVEDAPEGGYTAKALGYSIFTEADTWEDLKLAIQDALECHFEDDSKPRLVRLHYLREEVMAV
jgi:hypothetical protein